MRSLSTLRARLRALFRRSQVETEMAEEMRHHLDLMTEHNVAKGMDRESARLAALRSFGNVEAIKVHARAQRGWLWLEHTVQDLRFGLRQLVKAPTFTVVAILSLAIGIGLNTAVFSIVNALFYQSIRGVPDPQRVLFFNDARATAAGVERLREETTEVAAVVGARQFGATVGLGATETRGRVTLVTTGYFAALGVQPALGRVFGSGQGFTAERVEPVAVLSHTFWTNRLGSDPTVLGQVVRVNNASFTIIGVAGAGFNGPGPEGPAMWIPDEFAPLLAAETGAAVSERFAVFGRLRPGVSLPQAQAAVDLVVARSPDVFGGATTRFRLSAGRDSWRGDVSAEKRIEGLLVTAVPLVAVIGVLWIACSNVANLLLARAVQRRKELAIRIASGASRGRLVRMLMAESLLLAFAGGLAGLWVSQATLDFIFATLGNFSLFSVQLDGHVLLYTGAISVLAAVLFGLVPALQASRADVSNALKDGSADPARRGSRLRAFFLASQIAASLALLTIAGTFVKSLLAGAYFGAPAQQMRHLLLVQLTAAERVGAEREVFFRAAADKIASLPGVADMAFLAGGAPQRGAFRRPGEAAPGATVPDTEVTVQLVEERYFSTVGIERRAGERMPASVAGAGPTNAIINETLARRGWPDGQALGNHFEIGEQAYAVTGVVDDSETRPMIYVPFALAEQVQPVLLVRASADADDLVAPVSAVLRTMLPRSEMPRVTTYRESAFRTLNELTRLATFIGVLALALAATGIHASTSFSTQQRTQEIGIRMALGATRSAVVRLVLGAGFRVVLWGGVVGVVLAVAGMRVLGSLMGGGLGVDPIAIAGVLLFFALSVLLACLRPALRASRIDPVVALRME